MSRPGRRSAALPADIAAVRGAQAILRRRGGPAMERASALLDQVADDLPLDANVLARFGLSPQARTCATAIAEAAAEAAAGLDPPAPAPALVDGSFEAFLARQRDRVARHSGARGHTWGGARGGRGIKEDS